jgi:Uma2 family endonuclease
VARYARLGIPEYFLYDRARNRLLAYRLASPDAQTYTPIVPNGGQYESRVLGLEVEVDADRLPVARARRSGAREPLTAC